MDFFSAPLQFNKIIFQDKFYYPPQINHLIDQLTQYLKSNKQSNSPFIHLFAHNHVKTIVAYFAIIKANKICVLVDPDIKHIELGEMMQDTPPYAMIKINMLTEEFDYNNEIEFKDNNIWLQIFLLCFIVLGLINLFFTPVTQLLTLIIILIQFVVLYALYNSNRNKVREFEEKYSEVL